MTMSCDDAGTKPVRRLEVFTGAGHRRDWSDETKAAIIAESYAGMESISAVARRYALMPSQLFTWRRDARRAAEAADIASPPTEQLSEDQLSLSFEETEAALARVAATRLAAGHTATALDQLMPWNHAVAVA